MIEAGTGLERGHFPEILAIIELQCFCTDMVAIILPLIYLAYFIIIIHIYCIYTLYFTALFIYCF